MVWVQIEPANIEGAGSLLELLLWGLEAVKELFISLIVKENIEVNRVFDFIVVDVPLDLNDLTMTALSPRRDSQILRLIQA
jgi:cellulose biosynthesis protein BcsQ